jgi:hypothetical protein
MNAPTIPTESGSIPKAKPSTHISATTTGLFLLTRVRGCAKAKKKAIQTKRLHGE